MPKEKPKDLRAKATAPPVKKEKYALRLFITGILPNSARAVINIKAICEKYMKGNYDLEIIDIYQQPGLALKEDIVAVPFLIKSAPPPEVRIVGDLSDTQSVLKELYLI